MTADERRRLMAEGTRSHEQAKALRDADRMTEAFALFDRVHDINRRYRELLPDVTVARCPHTRALVRWPIDTMGLDSWFWDYLAPVRRVPQSLPPTWIAMTGAMRLAEPVEHPAFAVVPGPDAPFVVPRILRGDGVRAVIAEVPVGGHTGWALSYFGTPPEDVALVNLWGTNTYPVHEDGEWVGWDQARPSVAHYDFDLVPWLRSAKLLWIEPGDESATLREGPDGCPYTGIAGRRQITVISNGVVRHVRAFAGHGAG
ncbi:hypothetical protein [Actinophytocola sp.]|uniref:hypothetical protein n=1 Tax=Actinophytocola sp. TaxID=1872138 RepID=UPI00389A0D6F